MSYIIPFSYKNCFVGPDDKLFDQDIPNPELLVDEELSMLLVYIYVALREGRYTGIIVEPKYLGLLRQILKSHIFIPPKQNHEDYPDGQRNVKIDILDITGSEDIIYRGILMKPVYVPRDSTKLYEVYEVADPSKTLTAKFCQESLSYFNNVIRNNLSGKGPVIWSDPISGNTKLNQASDNYDKMFGLYVLDKLLIAIDPQYPYSDIDYNLAAGLTILDKLQTEILHPPTAVELTHKDFSLTAVILPTTGVEQLPTNRITSVVAVPESPERRNFCDVLHFFLRVGLTADTKFRVIFSGFKSCIFLNSLADMYPQGSFEVFGFILPKSAKNSRHSNIQIHAPILKPSTAAQYADQNVYFVSNADLNDSVILNLNPVTALVYYNSKSKLVPQIVFASCFTSQNAVKFKGRALVTRLSQTTNNSIVSSDFFVYVDNYFRNTNAWKYTNPITLENSDTFDNVFLASLVNQYLSSSKIKTSSLEYLSKVLAYM